MFLAPKKRPWWRLNGELVWKCILFLLRWCSNKSVKTITTTVLNRRMNSILVNHVNLAFDLMHTFTMSGSASDACSFPIIQSWFGIPQCAGKAGRQFFLSPWAKDGVGVGGLDRYMWGLRKKSIFITSLSWVVYLTRVVCGVFNIRYEFSKR